MIELDWEELGIDEKFLMAELGKKGHKAVNPFKKEIIFLKFFSGKFSCSLEKALDELYKRKAEFKAAYFFLREMKKFDPEVVVQYYKNTISKETTDRNILTMLFELYLKDHEAVKDIVYSSYLRSKKLLSYDTINKDYPGFDLAVLTEDACEYGAREAFISKEIKKTINVWHILRQEDSCTIFIFKKARRRRGLPSANKRSYIFTEFAKPIIIQFSDRGKKLETYTYLKNKQAIKIAQCIADHVTPSEIETKYDETVIESSKTNVDDLIMKVTSETKEDAELTLEKISFDATENENKSRVHVEKMPPHSVLDYLRTLSTNAQASYSSNTVNRIEVLFSKKRYLIYLDPQDTGVKVSYSTKDHSVANRRRFEDFFKKQFSINLNRR